MNLSVLYRSPHPNRLELHMAPGTRGPMRSPVSGLMDPTTDISIYAEGKRVTVQNWAWDPLGNRYVIFLTEDITGELLQVIHHVPSPPFQVQSNPTLGNITQGNSPTVTEDR